MSTQLVVTGTYSTRAKRGRPVGRSSFLLFLAVAAVGGWFLLQHFEIRGLSQLKLIRRDSTADAEGDIPIARRDQETIRIASFNLQSFGPTKAENPAVMEVLARIIREFDIVALQEVCSGRPDVLRNLLDRVNEAGDHYSLLAGPQVGRTADKQQFVFVFNQATIETDRSAAYTVDDPDDLLHRPPLVGFFGAGTGPRSSVHFHAGQYPHRFRRSAGGNQGAGRCLLQNSRRRPG